MQTTFDINADLLEQAMALANTNSKDEVLNKALEEFIRTMRRNRIADWPGNVHWDGDLDQMRRAE